MVPSLLLFDFQRCVGKGGKPSDPAFCANNTKLFHVVSIGNGNTGLESGKRQTTEGNVTISTPS
jgi:hypothetical protein